MSRLRQAFGLERRSLDGYGAPGAGSWGPGMNWVGAEGGGATKALRIAAVFACLRILTDAIATLPLGTFTLDGEARTPAEPPAYLAFRPGGLSRSRIIYFTQCVMSMLTDGNIFIATPRDRYGVPIGLVVLDPTRIEVRAGADGLPVYVFNGQEYNHWDVLHVPGLLMPGKLRGLSPIAYAREVIDTADEAQRHGRAWFKNLSVPPMLIKLPPSQGQPGARGKVSEQDKAREVARIWQETHGGAGNAGRVGVLIGGAEAETLAIPNRDAQWLESRQFSVQEVARIFGVPPHLIADASNSTSWGSGLAEQNLAFGQMTLRPIIERLEEAHNGLLYTHGQGAMFVKLNLDAFLRVNLAERYDSYAKGIDAGFLTIDEARRLEELPPLAPAAAGADPADIAVILQKVYLAVGKVITAEEARRIVNQAGAGLAPGVPDDLVNVGGDGA